MDHNSLESEKYYSNLKGYENTAMHKFIDFLNVKGNWNKLSWYEVLKLWAKDIAQG